jgi:peptidoglycan hydrolase-like protein with peptidoglycan-binding domain/LysM repeat protein
MSGERRRRFGGWLAGLLAATVLLLVPASGLAANETLERGAGYASHDGSQPVRELQRSLRRLGDRPGPVDGLYGPLTEAAVERFQQAHGLATDGVVGPQTKRRLLAQVAKRPVADTPRPTHTGQLVRKSPSGGNNPDESAIEHHQVRSAPSAALSRAGPSSPERVPPELLVLLAAIASGALLLALRKYGRRVREATVNFGMVCAALLATFVIGAAAGAVFATQAAPEAGGEAFADSGALLAARGAPSHRRAREASELRREAQARGVRLALKARRPAPRAQVSVPPTRVRLPAPVDNRGAAPRSPAPPERQAVVKRARAAPARSSTSTYTVRPGDALWRVAERHLARSGSVKEIAKQVQALESLNADRIASGDPDVLEAGEELRLR